MKMEYRYSQQNSPNNEQPFSQRLQGQDLLNDLYMDMFLQHLLADQQIRLLREAIDVALDARDEEAFKRFTKELIQLQDTLIDEE